MKYNKKYIWYIYFTTLPLCFLLLIIDVNVSLSENNFLGIDSSWELILSFLLIFILYSIMALLVIYWRWKRIKYSFDEVISFEKKSFFNPSKLALKRTISYDKMYIIGIEKGPFLKLFKLSRIVIGQKKESLEERPTKVIVVYDNNNIIEKMAEDLEEKRQVFKEKRIKEKAIEIMNPKKKDEESNKNLDYKFNKNTAKDYLINSVNIHIFCLLVTLIYFFTMTVFLLDLGFDLGTFMIFMFGYITLIFIIFTICIAYFVSLYSNYKVQVTTNTIKITYGKKNNKEIYIQKNDINAYVVKQNFIQKRRGFASVSLKVNANKELLVFPFIEENDIDKYLKFLEKGLQIPKNSNEYRKKSFRYYLITPYIFGLFITIFFIFGCIFTNLILAVILFCLYLLYCLSIFIYYRNQNKNQRIDYDDVYLFISNGSFTKRNVIIKILDIKAIQTISTPLKIKKDLVNIKFYYSFKKPEKISMMSQKIYAELILRFKLNA